LWHDANHDGISQPSELRSLADAGIGAIDLHYQEVRRTDEYGNIFRYRSKIYRKSGAEDGRWAYDVILLLGTVPTSVSGSLDGVRQGRCKRWKIGCQTK
jgi:hypothetical protein